MHHRLTQENSMYAVVSSGGKQYRVEAGSELVIERPGADTGSTITFDRVLLVGDGEAVTIGTPTVEGASVSGTVLGEVLGPKLIVFKFKQKATYRRKNGHRQHLTRVRIDEINGTGKRGKASKAEAADEAAAPETTKATSTKAEAADKKPATRKRAARADAAEEKPKTTRARTTKAKAKADEPDKPETAEE
jgi:large subunit ribosomal protein L21